MPGRARRLEHLVQPLLRVRLLAPLLDGPARALGHARQLALQLVPLLAQCHQPRLRGGHVRGPRRERVRRGKGARVARRRRELRVELVDMRM